ncbi:glycerophosphoryl diester phosphodiesterase [Desulforhabdus sp. TSK]|nr:glycerophosphoryl diester phosphodiesterase [Desulforhabdus sp. TSK]
MSGIFSRPVLNIAHRGARSLAPENTLAAARKALECGAHMWELDVGVTRDGELVVVHDATLDRTTNVQEIYPFRSPWRTEDFTLEELRRLDFGSWFTREDPFGELSAGRVSPAEGEGYLGEPVLTLQDAFGFTAEHAWLVNVEIKDLKGSPREKGLVEKVVSLIEALHLTGQAIVSSFNLDYLERVRTVSPGMPVGVLTDDHHPRPVELLRSLSAQAYHPRLSTIALDEISALREEGFHVMVWVVNDEIDMRALIAAGASGIFTDYPQRMARVLEEANLSAGMKPAPIGR